MRLIDADKLLTYLKDISIGAIPINGDGSRDEFNTWLKCMEVVKNQPTAYDVDKVVEQLESLEPFHIDGYGDVMVNCDDVIELVKEGGTDEDM